MNTGSDMITLLTFNRDVPVVRRVGTGVRAVDNLSGHVRSVPSNAAGWRTLPVRRKREVSE